MEGVERFGHSILRQEIADIVINYLKSTHMFGLVVQNLRIIIALDLRLPECAAHQAFKLLDILKAVLKIVEIVDVFQQLFGVGVAAYLHLFDYVDVGVFVFAHRCSYINNIGSKDYQIIIIQRAG